MKRFSFILYLLVYSAFEQKVKMKVHVSTYVAMHSLNFPMFENKLLDV